MFPPMCLPSASEETQLNDVLNENEIQIVRDSKKYSFKFKFLEICKELIKK